MCPQPKLWKQRNLGITASESVAQLAADQAWLAKCVADRRRAQCEAGTLHTYHASLRAGLAA